jgi:predicted porin
VQDAGDLKVVVVLEYGLDTQIADGLRTTSLGAPMFARQQMLAVAGGYGTVAVGYLQTTGYDWALKFDPTAGSAVSPLQSMAGYNLIGSNTFASRAQRALAYISPDLGGVTVAVNYTASLVGGLGNLTIADTLPDEKITATLLSATYNNGPLSVGGVYTRAVLPPPIADYREYALGASYDLSVVKLFATYQSMSVDVPTNPKLNVYSVSAVAPVGPGAVVFSYAKNKMTRTGFAGIGGNGYTLGWLQGLSKVTTAYLTLSRVTNDAEVQDFSVDNNVLASGTLKTGGSSRMLAAGLSNKF